MCLSSGCEVERLLRDMQQYRAFRLRLSDIESQRENDHLRSSHALDDKFKLAFRGALARRMFDREPDDVKLALEQEAHELHQAALGGLEAGTSEPLTDASRIEL